jgi:hypothetical protein
LQALPLHSTAWVHSSVVERIRSDEFGARDHLPDPVTQPGTWRCTRILYIRQIALTTRGYIGHLHRTGYKWVISPSGWKASPNVQADDQLRYNQHHHAAQSS